MTHPPAQGVRIDWEDVPDEVRAKIEERLGSSVVDARTQPAGFSPGLAARLTTSDRARAFVKGVPPDRNPDSPKIHRREIGIVSRLPEGLPTPRLLWTIDDYPEGWVVLAFEDVDGRHPDLPWNRNELDRVIAAIDRLNERLTPSPIEAPPAAKLVGRWQGWRRLAEQTPPELDPWARAHLRRLVDLEAQAPDAIAGNTLLHVDIRADNVLLTGEDVYVLDWPWASTGAPWVDALLFAPSVEMQGGPSAAAVFAQTAAGRRARAEELAAALAAFTGFLQHNGLQPDPPGLPTLRAFQRGQAEVGLRWLRALVGDAPA